MTFLSELDVINDMLATMGETALSTLEDGHPLVGPGRRILSTISWREQAKSWWFNKELVTLPPDPTGTIYLPEDTIRVDPKAPYLHYVQRGRRLYRPYDDATTDKYKFTSPATCWLVRHIPFEDLPATAQLAISYGAQLQFQLVYDADPVKTSALASLFRDASIALNTEHIRSQDVNLIRNSTVGHVLHSIGGGLIGHLNRQD